MKSREQIGAVLDKPGMTEVHNAAFSPDGRVALTTDQRVVRLWDPRTGEAIGQPFSLGDRPMFAQPPRFVARGHLLSPGRSVIWDKDLSWLLRDVSPEKILSEAELFSRRQVRADGAPEIIPGAQWRALRP
jgi:WD40 repeat protein